MSGFSVLLAAAILTNAYDWGGGDAPAEYDWIGTARTSPNLGPGQHGTVGPSAPSNGDRAVIVYPDPACPECFQHACRELERGGIVYEVRQRERWCPAGVVLHWWDGAGWRMQVWSSLDRFTVAYRRVEVSGPPASGPSPALATPRRVTVYSSGYPSRGNGHWTFPGNSRGSLINHLLSGEHRGKFSRAYLESLSYESLRELHDDDHEGRVRWQYVSRPQRNCSRRG